MKPLFYLLLGLSVASIAHAVVKEPPVPVRIVPTDYPSEMRRDGISGVVTINCLIDEHGNVSEPKVEKSTDMAFERPAIEALMKWKFKPGGAPVSVRVSIPIKFIYNS